MEQILVLGREKADISISVIDRGPNLIKHDAEIVIVGYANDVRDILLGRHTLMQAAVAALAVVVECRKLIDRNVQANLMSVGVHNLPTAVSKAHPRNTPKR